MAIKDGKFTAVGTANRIAEMATDGTEVIDLGGKVVLPGFVDDHIHIDMMSENTMNIRFDPLNDFEAYKAAVADLLERRPDAKWVFGGNVDWLKTESGEIVAWGKPSHYSTLDEVVSDRPAFMWDIGGHAALVNSFALEMFGIDKDTVPPEGGAYDYDENGDPTGVLRETAAIVLWEAFNADQPKTEDIAYFGTKPVVDMLSSLGITSLSDAGTRAFYVKAYNHLDEQGDLPLRVFAYITDSSDWQSQEMKEIAEYAIANPQEIASERVKPGGVKYVFDGSAGGQTLAMIDPFLGTDNTGPWRNSPERFLEKIVEWDEAGLLVKTHAVGDRAVRMVLDGVAQVRATGSTLPHSVAHVGFANPADRGRFAELNTNAELSPYFWYPTSAIEVIRAELGEERLGWAWPVKPIVESGAPYSFGSDWPVTEPNPWPAIEALVTRRVPGGPLDGDAFNAEFGIPLEHAIYGYTMGGAKAQMWDDLIGSITPGKSADMIVLDQNVFEVDENQISETKVLRTVFEGNVVHDAM